MLIVKGIYSEAKIFNSKIENTAYDQILELCNQSFTHGCKIRIMPDCHAGMGCVIGFTANLGDKVIPNIVGVDIGCGMLCIKLKDVDINLNDIDNIIRKEVPSGFNIHDEKISNCALLQNLKCKTKIKNFDRVERSIGTLGGGNHFIEIARNDNGDKYLIIHSGSRNLGKQVADYYQNLAIEICSGKDSYHIKRDNMIANLKAEGKQREIASALKKFEEQQRKLKPQYPKDLCFLMGQDRKDYLYDMRLCQRYAELNREKISEQILKANLMNFEHFHTVHNYIDFKNNIIRKGAVSAIMDELLIIPINMRDGSLLCKGKGNSDWNFSAPHGAGRIMSRSQARKKITLSDYQKSMTGIFTSSVNKETIDEAPMAYKPMQEIMDNIGDTVEIVSIIKPIYNFKASQ